MSKVYVQRARYKVGLQRAGRIEGELIDAAWDEAGVLVRRHWPAIDALAPELIVREYLDEVEAIAAASMPEHFTCLRQGLTDRVAV